MHNHITRSHTSNTLIEPKCNSNSGKRTFLVRAANCGILYHRQFVLSLIIWLCTILKQMSLLHHFKYFCTPYQFYEFCFLMYNYLCCISVNIMYKLGLFTNLFWLRASWLFSRPSQHALCSCIVLFVTVLSFVQLLSPPTPHALYSCFDAWWRNHIIVQLLNQL